MNTLLRSQDYPLANQEFGIDVNQLQVGFISRKNTQSKASTEHIIWLEYLRIVCLQLFAISVLLAVSYSVQANESFSLADSDTRLQLAALVDDEKRPQLFGDGKKISSSWAFAMDNDFLAPGHRDRDYTFGINLTYSGSNAEDASISLKAPLGVIDKLLGVDGLVAHPRNNHSVELGLFGFTPQELESEVINENDRPYASLVYFSSSHERIDVEKNVAWNSTLTIGALGLGWVGDLQNEVHQQISARAARGWDNEISDGGELTGRYVLARQDYLESFSDSVELKSTLQASVGYLTETSWGMSFRSGKIISPWASFNPDLISYGEKSTYSNNVSSTNEHYVWAGFTLKARFYNAFLQGQFRDSDLSYDYSELRPVIAEAWLGYTFAFKEGYRVSYVLRAQSSEIKRGDGDRSVVWGGLIFATTI
ncbi:MAG: lipid A deacylase LpxR family protein [Gammaproteobacteria bacterium]|nr:MAG: lipid A deacylase LpxR family protein [Gammaproteobacteria bacterium]